MGAHSIVGGKMRDGYSRARRDAARAIACDIPDPVEYARHVPLRIAVALVEAHGHAQGRRVALGFADLFADMRDMGLMDAGTNKAFLTAFGLQVRRALLVEIGEDE